MLPVSQRSSRRRRGGRERGGACFGGLPMHDAAAGHIDHLPRDGGGSGGWQEGGRLGHFLRRGHAPQRDRRRALAEPFDASAISD